MSHSLTGWGFTGGAVTTEEQAEGARDPTPKDEVRPQAVAARKFVETSVHKPRAGSAAKDLRLVAREANQKRAEQFAAQYQSEPLKMTAAAPAGDANAGPTSAYGQTR